MIAARALAPKLKPPLRTRSAHGFASLDPFVKDIASVQPTFPLASKNVKILKEPTDFYAELLNLIRRARRRLFISSLYIGHSETELFQTLNDALNQNQTLTLDLHLDALRSTRPGPDSPALSLLPLIDKFPGRVKVHLFRSPTLRGLMKAVVPRRFDEGWGTWHAKVYGADDEVILSGANLNESYFTNRQDRYIHIEKQPQLADYCFSFLQTCAAYSYKLKSLPPGSSSLPYDLIWDNHAVSHPRILSAAQKDLNALQASFHKDHPLDESAETMISPIIQSQPLGMREEERSFLHLFAHLKRQTITRYEKPHMDLTSGYFGLHRPYQRFVIDSGIDCRILVASPEANGFLGSKGLSGLIPEAYTLLEKRFWNKVLKAKRQWHTEAGGGIELREWRKDGWTYHAKGVWVSPSGHEPPLMTLFGSTNLNSRSAHLDTELSFILVTKSMFLRNQLAAEVKRLRIPSTRVGTKTWAQEDRRVRLLTRALVGLGVQDML
ncbi:hypothetical protein SISNIDRAFT_444667 [Sistotremastrum niveocremeum HHB9708]|uniref:CDP-diacylglycerol--glycerol-3-phosphate 3-phosphatidyltransferase n=1 Tax=Sistotremastrum niveocremeum HHB9708 TaxID=1314777 RepID=A0A164QU88_9AGAM|nr:hypothetical protein SISNIDRAFT_444667 [Sistotremastrum niveocremeum HHB9708]